MANNVPDSTDWLSTPLSCFVPLEAALRCQVCKDFFKTPMITSCSHTFCSLCIRRALANDGKCPLCRRVEQEIKLRCNYSTEETVQAFAKARETALQLARNTVSTRLQKRAVEEDLHLDGNDAPEAKRLRTSARLKGRVVLRAPEEAALDGERDGDTEDGEMVVPASEAGNDEDEEYVEEPKDGLLPCPSCQKRMKDWQIWTHLESCPGPSTSSQPPQSPSKSPPPGQAQRRTQTHLKRLPPLNYAMLKDSALRRKAADLGISSSGPRALVERRHKEYTTLWNANCDAADPKSKAQLLADLDVWERTLGGRAPTGGRVSQSAATVRDKDFDGKGWAARHRGSFEELIASARRSREEATQKKDTREEEEEEEGEVKDAGEEPLGKAEGSRKEEDRDEDKGPSTEAASDEKPSAVRPPSTVGNRGQPQGQGLADRIAAHEWPFE